MDTKQTKNIILIVVIVLVVFIIGYFIISGLMGGNLVGPGGSQTSLAGKTVSEIMKLNTPAECILVGALENARANRKASEGIEVVTKLLIKGDVVREDGVSIFTDGTEKNTVNIINPKDKTIFTLLLDGSNKMASLDYALVGGDQRIVKYDNVSSKDITCKGASFNQNVLVPQNVCYMPPSTQTPSCF